MDKETVQIPIAEVVNQADRRTIVRQRNEIIELRNRLKEVVRILTNIYRR